MRTTTTVLCLALAVHGQHLYIKITEPLGKTPSKDVPRVALVSTADTGAIIRGTINGGEFRTAMPTIRRFLPAFRDT